MLAHNRAESLEELQAWNLSSPLLDEWIEAYNARHLNRDTGCTPAERLEPSAGRPLEGKPDGIFCLKEERKVAKDHTISLAGVTYTLPSDPVLVAFKVQPHIDKQRLRVWHSGQLVAELPHIDKQRLRAAPLKAEQLVEDILAATQHGQFRVAQRDGPVWGGGRPFASRSISQWLYLRIGSPYATVYTKGSCCQRC